MRAALRSYCAWGGSGRCIPSRHQSQEVRALLVARKLLQTKLLDVEFSIRGILRGFGLKMGEVSKGRFAARVRELAIGHAMLERITEPMLRARDALRTEYAKLHGEMLVIVKPDPVCRRLMTVPGVGEAAT
jgi:transposase